MHWRNRGVVVTRVANVVTRVTNVVTRVANVVTRVANVVTRVANCVRYTRKSRPRLRGAFHTGKMLRRSIDPAN